MVADLERMLDKQAACPCRSGFSLKGVTSSPLASLAGCLELV